MKRTISTYITLALALLATTACTDDLIDLPDNSGNNTTEVPDGYYFVLDTNVPKDAVQTRVAYGNTNYSYFEEDDRLGIYTFDAEGNLLEPHNAEYRVLNVENVETGNIRQVLENVDPAKRAPRGHHYVIYYPYIKDMYLDRLKNLTYGIHSNQNLGTVEHEQLSKPLTGYEVSDLLWDVADDQTTADGTHYAEIHLNHAMANIILNIGEDYLPASRPDDGYQAWVLNTPRRASGVKLTTGLTDEWGYTVDRTGSTTSIRMWNSGLSSSGAQQFRAAIPACQTIPSGTAFLRIETNEGIKQFRLKEDLALRPGKNYIFTVMKQNTDPDAPVIPDVTDDDSWVLDVLDPETGRPVGLLCREYLRYQPQIPEGSITDIDVVTGTEVLGGKRAISSQAWVFYNLQADGRTPELSTGTVLRFIYDIHINSGTSGGLQTIYDIWPAPHSKKGGNSQGIFTPDHGFGWVPSPTLANNGEEYGISSSEVENLDGIRVPDGHNKADIIAYASEKNFGMHGGTITWGNDDHITDFNPLPEGSAPANAQARNGHIAIAADGTATVNYSPLTGSYTDEEGYKVGVLSPRNLVDTRINEQGQLETVLYPLVKIGYNQFWISKSFAAKTLRDGTVLPCYNTKGDPTATDLAQQKPANITYPVSDGEYVDMGYIYPFMQNVTTDKGNTTNYDPYNDLAEMAGPHGTEWENAHGNEWTGRTSNYRPRPLYNKPAIDAPGFMPVAPEGYYEYQIPTSDEFTDMMEYLGCFFAGKLFTREISTTVHETKNAYKQYTALMRGEMYNSGVYCANICGFNLRMSGYNEPAQAAMGSDLGSPSRSTALILRSKTTVPTNSVSYISFQSYSPWSTGSLASFFEDEALQYNNIHTKFFAQVRLYMRFLHPTSGASVTTRSASNTNTQASCNVYVPLETME